MALSPTTETRQTVLAALKADATFTSIIPKASIFPTKTPNAPGYPFARYGASSAQPQRASCWAGADVAGAVHLFFGQSDTIADPEARCGDALDAAAEVIDGIEDCYVERTQIIPDPEEPDVMHGIVFFTRKVLAEA